MQRAPLSRKPCRFNQPFKPPSASELKMTPPRRRGLTNCNFTLYAAVVLLSGLSRRAMRKQLGDGDPELSGLWSFLMSAPIKFAIAPRHGDHLVNGVRDQVRFALLGLTM